MSADQFHRDLFVALANLATAVLIVVFLFAGQDLLPAAVEEHPLVAGAS